MSKPSGLAVPAANSLQLADARKSARDEVTGCLAAPQPGFHVRRLSGGGQRRPCGRSAHRALPVPSATRPFQARGRARRPWASAVLPAEAVTAPRGQSQLVRECSPVTEFVTPATAGRLQARPHPELETGSPLCRVAGAVFLRCAGGTRV